MKRAWMLILLISLGLNVGLAVKVFTLKGDGGKSYGYRRGGERRMEGRNWPAPGDSATWRKVGLKRMDRFREKLDLTPEQAATFQANQERAVLLLAGKRREIKGIRMRIRDFMTEETIDREAIRTAHSELGLKQAEFDSLVTETVLRDLEILDPDQRERYLRMHPYGSAGHSGSKFGHGKGPGDR